MDGWSERLKDVELYIGISRSSYILRKFQSGLIGSSYTFHLSPEVEGRWDSGASDNDKSICGKSRKVVDLALFADAYITSMSLYTNLVNFRFQTKRCIFVHWTIEK
ncbi:hypothetical protein ACF0H5_021512 [Mactra antiquata]